MEEGKSNQVRIRDPEQPSLIVLHVAEWIWPAHKSWIPPLHESSTQQTPNFLARFCDDLYFPEFDAKLEWTLMQMKTSVLGLSLDFCHRQSSLPLLLLWSMWMYLHVYASPKGKEAVQSARAASIPTKTKEQRLVVRSLTGLETCCSAV